MRAFNFFLLILVGAAIVISTGCGRFGPLSKDPNKGANSDPLGGDGDEEETLQGAPLNDMALLHKLSMALRGTAPTLDDYKALKAAAAEKKEQDFFSQKTKEYLGTNAFSERMVLKLEELFYLKTTSVRPLLVPGAKDLQNASENFGQFSSTENLFREVFSKNLSWDFLLTGKSYRLPIYRGETFELKFFRNVLGLPSELNSFEQSPDFENKITPDSYKEISFDNNDTRIAGVLTSPRFLARYTNTGLNKNRRRAAAVFRIFLCDPMTTAIPETHDSKSLADLVFPEGKTVSEEQIMQPQDLLHGSQPDCMACHYKLDPMGLAFRQNPLVLHEEPSAGALVFNRANGEKVNKSGQGIGEVAKFISEQPEYANCQVEHFWNWFIGTDIPLGKKTRAQLVKTFDEVGRRSNDFVSYLVSRPEFKIRRSNDPQRAMVVDVKNFLKRCDSCHDGAKIPPGGKLPRFAVWPIGDGSAAQSSYWLTKISRSLDLDNQGKNRTMPTKDGFRPTIEELGNIKKWIEQGAPNERGQKMVSP